MSSMSQPSVSIITVVYNAREELKKTISSIRTQTWPHYEYLIIDGGSTDGTVEVILENQGLIHHWVSEPDQGLYDAMNKGLEAATGDFVWFLNAGDQIYSPDTLKNIFTHQNGPGRGPAPSEARAEPDHGKPGRGPAPSEARAEPDHGEPGRGPFDDGYADLYYGDTMVVDANYQEIGLRRLRPPKNLTWKSFRYGMLVCHQSILVRRKLADPYDLTLPHSADFDWVIKALKKTTNVVNTHQILSAFLDGGQSKKTIQPSLAERLKSMSTHYGLLPSLLRHIPITIRFTLYLLKHKRF